QAGRHVRFFADMDTPGARLVRTPVYSHSYASHHPIYRFENVRVPAANRIGEEGDGMGFTYSWFRYERLGIAARCCGAAARLIEEATAFAKERRQVGEAVAHFQAGEFMLGDSRAAVLGARVVTLPSAGGD